MLNRWAHQQGAQVLLAAFVVLAADGDAFKASRTVLDSDGNSFVVGAAALDSDGNSFVVD